MQRIKELNYYQKGILIIMIAMALVFAVIYPQTISRVGYRYVDAFLVRTQENGNTLYSGEIKGKEACFTVSNNTVLFQYGDKTYGTYTVKEDSTAIPKDHYNASSMTGFEVLEGDTILFRGGVFDDGYGDCFYNEDGTLYYKMTPSMAPGGGIITDKNGNIIDTMEPTVSTIYELANNLELTHEGEGIAWFGAVFLSILNVLSILFADELFRFALSFRVSDAYNVEPSEWEIAGRYIGWTVITIVVLVIYIRGLQ